MRIALFVGVILGFCLAPIQAVDSVITAYQPLPFFDNPGVIDGTIQTIPIVDGQPNQAPYGYVVYLPPGYGADTTTTWPVVFCLQGTGEFGTGKNASHIYSRMTTSGPLRQILGSKWDFPAICITPQAFSFGMSASSYPPGASGGWGSSNYLKGMVEFVKTNYKADAYRIYMTGLCEGGQGTINYATNYRADLAAIIPIQVISRPGGNPGNGQPGPTDAQRSAVVSTILDLPIWFVHTWGDRGYKKENHLMWADDVVRTLTGQSGSIMNTYPYLYGQNAPGYDRFAAVILPATGWPSFTGGLTEGSGGAESITYSNCTVTPGSNEILRTGKFPSWGSVSWTGDQVGLNPGALLEIGSGSQPKVTIPIYYSNTSKIILTQPYNGTLSGSNITVKVITPNGYPVTSHYGAAGWTWVRGFEAPLERPAVERIFTLYPVNSHAWGWRWVWNNPSAWNWLFRQAKPGAPTVNTPPTITIAVPATISEGQSLAVTANAADSNFDPLTVTWDLDGDAAFDDGTGTDLTFGWSTLVANGNAQGSFVIAAKVDDGRGGTALAQATVTVLNLAPIVQISGPLVSNEGQGVTLTAVVADPGGDIVTVAWDLDSDGQPDDAAGTSVGLTWAQVVTYGLAVGTHPLAVVATDADGAVASASTTLTIVNLAPVVTAGGPYAVVEGSNVLLAGTASDPGGDTMSLGWDLNADGVFTDALGATPTVSWSALASLGLGSHALSLVAVDAEGASTIATTTVTITSIPPTAAAGGPYAILEGQTLNLIGSGNSVGGRALTYAWDLDADGQFDDVVGSSPSVQWASLNVLGLGVGAHTVSLRVTDDLSAIADASAQVVIGDVATILSAGGPYAINEGSALLLAALATDPGIETFVYAWDLNADGIFTDATGANPAVSWQTLASLGLTNGTYPLAVSVGSASSSAQFTVANLPPVASIGGPYAAATDTIISLAATATDPGNDALTFAWDLNNDGIFSDATGAAPTLSSAQLAALGAGEHAISVRVTDTEGASATAVGVLALSSPNGTPAGYFDNPGVVDGTITTVPVVIGGADAAPYGFVIYLPPGYDPIAHPNVTWPLVVSLHGRNNWGTGASAADLLAKTTNEGPLAQVNSAQWDLPAIIVAPQAFRAGMNAAFYPAGAGFGWNSAYLQTFVHWVGARYTVDPLRISVTGNLEGGDAAFAFARQFPGDVAAIVPIQTIFGPSGNSGTPSEAARSAIVAPLVTIPMWGVHAWGDRFFRKESHLMWFDDVARVASTTPSTMIGSYPFLYGRASAGYRQFAAVVDPGTGMPSFTAAPSEGSAGAESLPYTVTLTNGSQTVTGSFPSWAGNSWTGNISGTQPGAMLRVGGTLLPIYFANASTITLASPYTGASGSQAVQVVTPDGYPVTGSFGSMGWTWNAGVAQPADRPAVERVFTLYPSNGRSLAPTWAYRNIELWNWLLRQRKAPVNGEG